MNKIDTIVVHCSESEWGTAREIRKWHTDPKPKGRGWPDIGYHFVVLNGKPYPGMYLPSLDGSIECGRPLDADGVIEAFEIGIHALGYNDHSIGVCLIGMKVHDLASFTIRQFDALKKLLLDLCGHYSVKPDGVLGHRETESGKAQGKTCPDFDVGAFRTWLRGRV